MHISSRWKILLGFYLLVCVGIFVVRTIHWKQVNDPAQLSYLCFLMDHGMAPYRDLLEINMPGIYLVNWSVMHTLGAGSLAWRIFDFSLMGAAAWAMIVIARPYDWFAGALGAALFVLYHSRDGAGQAGQRDFIIAVLLLCAYAFLFHFFRQRCKWALFAFGLCAGMSATIKPMPLPFVLVLLVLAVFWLRGEGEPILRPSLYALLGLLIPFAVVAVFLVEKHSVGSFWYLLHVELPFYKTLGRLAFSKLTVLAASASVRALALIALAIALLKWDRWNWEHKLLVAGIIFGIASFFGQGKGFPYHRSPMLAFLFLWVGIQIVSGLRARGTVGALAITGLTFALILTPLYVREASRKVWDPQFTDSLAADLNHLGGHQLSGHVQCIYMPAEVRSGVDSRERTSPGSPAESCRVLTKEATIKLTTLNDGLLFPNLVGEGLATTLPELQRLGRVAAGNVHWPGTVRRGSIRPYAQWARGSENPAVNEIVEFVHANPCVDVHQDGT